MRMLVAEAGDDDDVTGDGMTSVQQTVRELASGISATCILADSQV